jgi:MFS-type transporter involved in bile tolerance (Atg22 family)
MGERQPRTYASLEVEGAEDEVVDEADVDDKCSASTRGDQHPDATPSASSSSESFPAAAARKASISEVATEANTSHCAPPSWLARIVEFPFRVKNPVTGVYLPEATAWAMDAAGRGPLNQVGSYVGTAILRLAIREAGCTANTARSCRLHGGTGLKATSLLTLTSASVGVATAVLMPILGAVVDHTSHRKAVGALSAFCVVLCTGLYMTMSESANSSSTTTSDGTNWRWVLTIDSFQSFFLILHATASFAYLPDLSTDEQAIVHYTSSFSVRQYSAQLVYSIAVLASALNRDRSIASSVRLARDASAMAFAIAAVLFLYSWTFLFRPRPALSKVPPGDSLLTTGFRQVKSTVVTIARDYKALKWFMISILWSPEHGAGVVQAIVVSWLISEVGFTGEDVSITNVILLATSVVGAKVSILIVQRVNALNSYRIALFCFACIIAMSVALVNGPDKRRLVFAITAAWGANLGWIYASQRVLFCTLIPKGQELELMGLFTFLGQILGWLPPLLVTIGNERGMALRYGLLVVSGFCLLAVVCTLPMGDYKTARDLATERSAQKLLEVSMAARTSETSMATRQSSLSMQEGNNRSAPSRRRVALDDVVALRTTTDSKRADGRTSPSEGI